MLFFLPKMPMSKSWAFSLKLPVRMGKMLHMSPKHPETPPNYPQTYPKNAPNVPQVYRHDWHHPSRRWPRHGLGFRVQGMACALLAKHMYVDNPHARSIGHVGDSEAAAVASTAGDGGIDGHDIPPNVWTGVVYWLRKGGLNLDVELNAFRREALEDAPYCYNDGCEVVRQLKDFKVCPQCKAARYCGDACQKMDWTTGGHKATCGTFRIGLRTRTPYIATHSTRKNRPISVYRLGEMPIQSCGQSVSARRGQQYTEIGLLHWTPLIIVLLCDNMFYITRANVCKELHHHSSSLSPSPLLPPDLFVTRGRTPS